MSSAERSEAIERVMQDITYQGNVVRDIKCQLRLGEVSDDAVNREIRVLRDLHRVYLRLHGINLTELAQERTQERAQERV